MRVLKEAHQVPNLLGPTVRHTNSLCTFVLLHSNFFAVNKSYYFRSACFCLYTRGFSGGSTLADVISLLKQSSIVVIEPHVVPEGCSRNGISRLQVLWPGYILILWQQSLSCSPSAERTEFCETGTSHTAWRNGGNHMQTSLILARTQSSVNIERPYYNTCTNKNQLNVFTSSYLTSIACAVAWASRATLLKYIPRCR